MIDTLKLARRLEDTGMSPEQAKVLTEELNEGLKEQAVSKLDLEIIITKLEAKLTTKFAVMLVIQLFAIIGVIKAIH